MSRIRSIHPGIWTDDTFMALSVYARLLYIGLLNEAWDDGVFEWKPLTIKARIFPVDNVDVPALLEELEANDKIARRDDPKPHGLIRNFRDYQRPKKPNSSGLLAPDDAEYVGLVPNQYGTDGGKSEQMEDGGGRMDDEEPSPPPVPDPGRGIFDEIWKVFPRNPTSSQATSLRAFDTLTPDDQEKLLEAASNFKSFFELEQVMRKRPLSEALRYAPKLNRWISEGNWREHASGPGSIYGHREELVVVQAGTWEFAALEKKRGKPFVVGNSGSVTVTKAELEQAQGHAHAA